jgi:hypothetical protein
MKLFCHIILLGVFLCACHPSVIYEPRRYVNYLMDPDNGLIKEKSIAGVKIRVRYLPSEYIAYTILKGKPGSQAFKDSVRSVYENSVTFLMTIGPDDTESFDITRVGISNYGEYTDRMEEMLFYMQQRIQLLSQDSAHRPSITRMENINAQANSRDFIVVFGSDRQSESDLRKNDMCFIYNDELFDTGINKFLFRERNIRALPEFKF